MSNRNGRCTTRKQDWTDLWEAVRVFPRGRLLHELKNIVVEEWRRWRGKCPDKDEHETEVVAVDRPGPPSMAFAKRVERLIKEDDSKGSGV